VASFGTDQQCVCGGCFSFHPNGWRYPLARRRESAAAIPTNQGQAHIATPTALLAMRRDVAMITATKLVAELGNGDSEQLGERHRKTPKDVAQLVIRAARSRFSMPEVFGQWLNLHQPAMRILSCMPPVTKPGRGRQVEDFRKLSMYIRRGQMYRRPREENIRDLVPQ
jgi:hypothetical protein